MRLDMALFARGVSALGCEARIAYRWAHRNLSKLVLASAIDSIAIVPRLSPFSPSAGRGCAIRWFVG